MWTYGKSGGQRQNAATSGRLGHLSERAGAAASPNIGGNCSWLPPPPTRRTGRRRPPRSIDGSLDAHPRLGVDRRGFAVARGGKRRARRGGYSSASAPGAFGGLWYNTRAHSHCQQRAPTGSRDSEVVQGQPQVRPCARAGSTRLQSIGVEKPSSSIESYRGRPFATLRDQTAANNAAPNGRACAHTARLHTHSYRR